MKFLAKRLSFKMGLSIVTSVVLVTMLNAGVAEARKPARQSDAELMSGEERKQMFGEESGPAAEQDVKGKQGRLKTMGGYMEEQIDAQINKPDDKRFAFITWVQSREKYSETNSAITVGAAIRPNAVVSVPSAKIPVVISNTSNWYVQEIQVGEPPVIVPKSKITILYHPDFTMNADRPHRLVLILTNNTQESSDPLGFKLFALVASPLLPDWETHRHDDYGLANCEMAVQNPITGGLSYIPMMVYACVHSNKARQTFKDRVCAYTRIEKHQRGIMIPPSGKIFDVGSPLYCGRVLVGVYAGVQNVHGDISKAAHPGRRSMTGMVTKRMLDHDQQYIFEVPGASANHEFLSQFTYEGPQWTAALPVGETNECFEGKHAPPNKGRSFGLFGVPFGFLEEKMHPIGSGDEKSNGIGKQTAQEEAGKSDKQGAGPESAPSHEEPPKFHETKSSAGESAPESDHGPGGGADAGGGGGREVEKDILPKSRSGKDARNWKFGKST